MYYCLWDYDYLDFELTYHLIEYWDLYARRTWLEFVQAVSFFFGEEDPEGDVWLAFKLEIDSTYFLPNWYLCTTDYCNT